MPRFVPSGSSWDRSPSGFQLLPKVNYFDFIKGSVVSCLTRRRSLAVLSCKGKFSLLAHHLQSTGFQSCWWGRMLGCWGLAQICCLWGWEGRYQNRRLCQRDCWCVSWRGEVMGAQGSPGSRCSRSAGQQGRVDGGEGWLRQLSASVQQGLREHLLWFKGPETYSPSRLFLQVLFFFF